DLAESDGLISSLRERGQRLFQLVVVDGVFELLLTVLRTGELVVYFIPLFIAYPAVWFGKRNLDRGGESAGALWWYKLLRIQMSRAGPTFVKLSQWAASRTDLFNMQLCLELGKLHDSNQVHSPQKSQRAIAKAFGVDSIEQIFESFDDRPLGAGAVAQVHRGRISDAFIERQLAVATDFGSKRALEKLKANPEVAVKVLHPRVERKIRRDLRIMEWGARALSLLPGIKWLSLPEEVA
ncbi:hypothetical protein GGH97_006487, partial [Coemansia sp. RSA 475]